MRYAAITAILGLSTLGGTAPALAATTPHVWQGTAFITSVTGACTSAGVEVTNDDYTIVYRPIIGGVQAGPEGLSFVNARAAQYWSTLSATASFSSSALANILTLGSHANSTTASSAGGYSLIILPNSIAANTQTVTISGLLSNFWDVKGCNVTITAALDRRP